MFHQVANRLRVHFLRKNKMWHVIEYRRSVAAADDGMAGHHEAEAYRCAELIQEITGQFEHILPVKNLPANS